MAKTIIDLSGRGGLLERYQGDLNDTSSSPHLRYLGGDNQFAEGQFNPFSYYGYMSPPNNTFTPITGTISAGVNSFAYDNETGTLYASESGTKILSLSDLEDTSVATHLTLSTGTLKDMVVYEVNGQKALVYAIDSGSTLYELNDITTTSELDFFSTGGQYLGFQTIESGSDKGALTLDGSLAYQSADSVTIEFSATALDDGTSFSTALAQGFNPKDVDGKAISGVGMRLQLFEGTGSGATIRASLQADGDPNAGIYTSQGAWATSTYYAVNDTVTNDGVTYACWQAHTSSASDEPGTGANDETYWHQFGAPSGTILASATVAASSIPDGEHLSPNYSNNSKTAIESTPYTWFDFGTQYTLDPDTKYWIVLEETGSDLTSSDGIGWARSTNDDFYYDPVLSGLKAKYFNGTTWRDGTNGNAVTGVENFDFQVILDRKDDWTANMAAGYFGVETGLDSFLYLGDNGLLYWFVGNQVHSIDGSLTGGTTGTANKAVLVFPSYTSIPDVAETRGRMYIGVQTSERSTSLDDKFFGAYRSGVFVWDRRSQVLGGTDFFPTPGAREIRNLFTSSTGDVVAITVNNSGFSEIRQLSGNQYVVVQTMEKGAYPESRRGISQVGNFSVWLGYNGIFYAYGSVAPGEPLRLYKIGTAAGLTNFSAPGAIFVGNKDTSNNELAIYFGWTDSGPGYNMSKWYPNGEGTIDSNAQKAGQGDAYTRVQQLAGLSTVQYIRGFHMPGGSDGDATVAGTLKCYVNQSSTPAWSHSITYDDLYKGWFQKEWNKPNVNFLQFEVEWNTTPTLGSNTYRPIYLEVETQDEGRINS